MCSELTNPNVAAPRKSAVGLFDSFIRRSDEDSEEALLQCQRPGATAAAPCGASKTVLASLNRPALQ
jgi:hypothetical protein